MIIFAAIQHDQTAISVAASNTEDGAIAGALAHYLREEESAPDNNECSVSWLFARHCCNIVRVTL